MDGFGPKVFAWFKGLERDNTREYFTSTRDFYEDKVRDALEDLLHEIGGDDVKVFRQHRDLRFTKDKSPYKTRTYGIAGRLYVALSAEGLYAGTGYYRMEREQLERYREAVDDGSGRGRGRGGAGRAGDPRRAAQDRAARLSARPPADRPAAAQAADRRASAARREGDLGRARARARA